MVDRRQRFSRKNPCPICKGGEDDLRGKGKRCTGFASDDGRWVRCSREEHAGALSPEQSDAGVVYRHMVGGPCNCGVEHAPARPSAFEDRIVCTYDYCDERGAMLFQCVRLRDPKAFRQRQPAPGGKWAWNLQGARRVLFRLPELLAADPSAPVYVVEGEKDALALVKLGLVATCNPMGAGKWRQVEDCARKALAGRDVIVIADADPPEKDVGRPHARAIVESLAGVARSVRALEPPSPHKDVSDLLGAGGTLDQLVPLAPSPDGPSEAASGVRQVAPPIADTFDAPLDPPAGAEWLDALDAELPLPPEKLNGSARTAPREPEERPEVQMDKDIHRVIDEVQRALASDPLVYQQTHRLVTLVGAEPKPNDRVVHSTGAPIIRELSRDSLLPRLSRHVRLMAPKKRTKDEEKIAIAIGKQKDKEWVEIVPPPLVTGPLLACGEWADMPHLIGISETPVLRPDGSLWTTRGYDAETGYLYAPSIDYPEAPARPTLADAMKAYARLADVFVDFPYVDASHRSATVAAILTLVGRSAIDGAVPCWLFDAASKRSGKSLQANVIAYIATGRAAAAMTYPESEEELEKVLAGFAIDGARIINFDNVARPFGGAPLDKCLTAVDTVQLRVLGRTGNPTLIWRAVILASGNNVTARGDMLPRVLSPRIESQLENPETRGAETFTHPERAGEDRLCSWAKDNRGSLVMDALTVLRAYIIAGRPAVEPEPRWMGFSAWTRLVAASLVWAGAPSPLGARRGMADDDDPHAAAERGLVTGWGEMCQRLTVPSLTASAAIAELYPAPGKDDPPDGYDDLREAIQTLINARPGFTPTSDQLSRAMRAVKARPLGGWKIVSDGISHGTARWRPVKLGQVLPFRPPTPPAPPPAPEEEPGAFDDMLES